MKARIPNQGQAQNQYMQKLQQMQEEMARVQTEVEEREYSASSGGGVVEVSVSGKHEVKSIKMSPDVIDPEDIDMLEDLLLAAINEAMRKADETMEQEMSKVTGEFGAPGVPGFPGM